MRADLSAPLDEFYDRTAQIRRVVALTEAASRDAKSISSPRKEIDLSKINLSTGNTANSMAIVFLASSFEEFVREEVSLCGSYLATCYDFFPLEEKQRIRNNYWSLCTDRMKFVKGILTSESPKNIDLTSVGKIRNVVESARGFVLMDDPKSIDGRFFGHHSNNFKPAIVNEIVGRLGLKNIFSKISDNSKIRRHLGVNSKAESERKLTTKLNAFYDTRNEIVHSSSSSTGYGVDIVLDYAEIFEISAEAIKTSLEAHIATWQQQVSQPA